MILLGGVTGRDVPGYHDWNNILSQLGLLKWDHTLARLAHLSGSVFIVIALSGESTYSTFSIDSPSTQPFELCLPIHRMRAERATRR